MNKGPLSDMEYEFLKDYAKFAAHEDRRLHGIPDNETNRNNRTFLTRGIINNQPVQNNSTRIPQNFKCQQ